MNTKSEWQKAIRELAEEDRRRLGAPPTAEEMLAYSRGELSEAEEERIQDLLVAYPELARMYSTPFDEQPGAGDSDVVPPEQLAASWNDLQRRVGIATPAQHATGRLLVFPRHLPAAIAAALAVVFLALFMQSEKRARELGREAMQPRMLGAAQELTPGGSRGGGAPTMLRRDGEAYLLKPRLINEVRYPHYQLELRDSQKSAVWTNNTAEPDEDDAFQIVIPHSFLRGSEDYQLHIFGVDGERRELLGTYDVRAAGE